VSQRLAQAGMDAAQLEVVRSGAVNRLYSGPFETRALALEAARVLPSSLGIKPIVVKR
jgi:rare lipoprotein A